MVVLLTIDVARWRAHRWASAVLSNEASGWPDYTNRPPGATDLHAFGTVRAKAIRFFLNSVSIGGFLMALEFIKM
jgi:hypothetical protein